MTRTPLKAPRPPGDDSRRARIRSGENIDEPSSGPTWRDNAIFFGLGQPCLPIAGGGGGGAAG